MPASPSIGNRSSAGTLVETNRGFEPIETIEKGRKVWACNTRTGQWQLDTVAETFRREYEGEMVTITAGGETIQATARHPFWVVEGDDLENRPITEELGSDNLPGVMTGRWVEAQYLQEGDVLLSREQGEIPLEEITVFANAITVHNLHVSGSCTYTAGRILVHNLSPDGDGGCASDFIPNEDEKRCNSIFNMVHPGTAYSL